MYYFLIVSIKLHTARWSLNVCICLKVRMERENLSLNNLQECSFSALRDFIYGGWEINDLPIRYTFTLYSINFQIFFFGGGRGQWLQLLFDKKNNNNSVLHVQIF